MAADTLGDMLTNDEIRAEILEQVVYWPGWAFGYREDLWEGPCIIIETEQPDPHKPGETTVLRNESYVPPIPDPTYFGLWLQWRLCRISGHEAREGLRHRGQMVDDPHSRSTQ